MPHRTIMTELIVINPCFGYEMIVSAVLKGLV